jgi:streptogramin lyase
MKKISSRIKQNLLLLVCASVVAACGGGENQEGALDAFDVTPDASTLTWPQDQDDTTPPVCGASFMTREFVNGGAAPYTIQNTAPGTLSVTDAAGNPIGRINDAAGSFDVYSLGGCFDSLIINVVDALGRQIDLELTSEPEGGTQ